MIICVNGKFVTEKEAKISPLDNGFLYGDGFYDTMRTYDGIILEHSLHEKRIIKSAALIGITIPWSIQKISSWTKRLVKLNAVKDGRVRVTITRGKQGFDFIGCKKPTLLIIAEKLDIDFKIYTKGVAAYTVKLQRVFPEIKILGLTTMISAYRSVLPKGGYEAILVDDNNYVTEGASTNIFMVKNGCLFTPKNKILLGLTRQRVIELASLMGVRVKVADFTAEELNSAEEIFLTNRPREIIPVVKLNNKKVGGGTVGEMTKKIMISYQEYVDKCIH